MDIALEEAKKALEKEEVPIGCAVFYRGNCIDKAHNLTNKNKDPLAHAEVLCLERIDSNILSEIELYVTCEPCVMCLALILKMGIKKVVYGCINPRFGGLSLFKREGILQSDETRKNDETSAESTEYFHPNQNYSSSFSISPNILQMSFQENPDSITLLKGFYLLENERAPVEKRKLKSLRAAKNFKNGRDAE